MCNSFRIYCKDPIKTSIPINDLAGVTHATLTSICRLLAHFLPQHIAIPKAGATAHCDDSAKACYSYDADTQELISYDTPKTFREKVAYLQETALDGSMF